MRPEVKETLEPTKSTVMVRFELGKKVHKDCMSIHANDPNTMTFADSMAEIVKEGVKAINAKRAAKRAADSKAAFHFDESRERQETQTR